MRFTQRERFIMEAIGVDEVTTKEIKRRIKRNRNKVYNEAVIASDLNNLIRDNCVASILRPKETKRRIFEERYYYRTI